MSAIFLLPFQSLLLHSGGNFIDCIKFRLELEKKFHLSFVRFGGLIYWRRRGVLTGIFHPRTPLEKGAQSEWKGGRKVRKVMSEVGFYISSFPRIWWENKCTFFESRFSSRKRKKKTWTSFVLLGCPRRTGKTVMRDQELTTPKKLFSHFSLLRKLIPDRCVVQWQKADGRRSKFCSETNITQKAWLIAPLRL